MSQLPGTNTSISIVSGAGPWTRGWTGQLASGSVFAFDQPRNTVVETEKLLLFVLEALTSPTERGLLAALRDNPNDVTVRAAYSDYLEEQGRPTGVNLIRNKNFTPGGKASQ